MFFEFFNYAGRMLEIKIVKSPEVAEIVVANVAATEVATEVAWVDIECSVVAAEIVVVAEIVMARVDVEVADVEVFCQVEPIAQVPVISFGAGPISGLMVDTTNQVVFRSPTKPSISPTSLFMRVGYFYGRLWNEPWAGI